MSNSFNSLSNSPLFSNDVISAPDKNNDSETSDGSNLLNSNSTHSTSSSTSPSSPSLERILGKPKHIMDTESSGTSFDNVKEEQFIQISPIMEEYNNPENEMLVPAQQLHVTTLSTSNTNKESEFKRETFSTKSRKKLEYEDAKNNFKKTKIQLDSLEKMKKLLSKEPDFYYEHDRCQIQNQTIYFKDKYNEDKQLFHKKRKERIKQFYHRTH
ncbi:hypothetical protein QTN25_000478 [Entamoeba marina]